MTKQKMDKTLIKNIFKFPISRTSRKYVIDYYETKKKENFRLIMTLLVRNEEKIIEKHIRFHKAMGVDGIIVTSHMSTDKTNEILYKLKKEGIVLEIIEENNPNYQQNKFVKNMINIAKKKYKADWIINADSDEFYYSSHLNLKESLFEFHKAKINAIELDSRISFPCNEDDFLQGNYFVIRLFHKFESENIQTLRKDIKERFTEIYPNSHSCPKIIHSTKGFKNIGMGNHTVKIHNKRQVPCQNICLYHYTVRNYKGLEEKIKRFIDTAQTMPGNLGVHVKKLIDIYKNNQLKEYYDNLYNEKIRNELVQNGIVSIDNSVKNFLEYKL